MNPLEIFTRGRFWSLLSTIVWHTTGQKHFVQVSCRFTEAQLWNIVTMTFQVTPFGVDLRMNFFFQSMVHFLFIFCFHKNVEKG